MDYLSNKRAILYIIICFFLTGCFASTNSLIQNEKIRLGMTKYQLNGVFAFQSILENPLIPTAYREYFDKEKKEILSDDNNRNAYYVFTNVYDQVTCGWVMCKLGDGRLDRIFYNYNDAINYVKETDKVNYKPKNYITIKQGDKKEKISSDTNTLAEIRKLAKDYEDGKISETEFEKKKKELLK
tara:strand:- start:681 stop:1232 length:552 start_codon:yes stop_codon:yes gene_type:complete